MFKKSLLGLALGLGLGLSLNSQAQQGEIRISQEQLKTLVAQALQEVAADGFKKEMVYAIRLTEKSPADLPRWLMKELGRIDAVKYTDQFLTSQQGGAVIVQVTEGKLDVYVTDAKTAQKKYAFTDQSQVAVENPKLVTALSSITLDQVSTANIPVISLIRNDRLFQAAQKTGGTTYMIRMSELGIPIQGPVTIDDPWGNTQTKPAGQDAFVVLDLNYETQAPQHYIVNTTSEGFPIAYLGVDDATNARVARDHQILASYLKGSFDLSNGGTTTLTCGEVGLLLSKQK